MVFPTFFDNSANDGDLSLLPLSRVEAVFNSLFPNFDFWSSHVLPRMQFSFRRIISIKIILIMANLRLKLLDEVRFYCHPLNDVTE